MERRTIGVRGTDLESVVPVALERPGDERHPGQGSQGAGGVDALGHAHRQTHPHALELESLAGTLKSVPGERGRLYDNALQAVDATDETILFLERLEEHDG